MKIGFIGLGKLGLPCAMAIESKGHEVTGWDTDPKIQDYLKDRKVPYKEKDIEKCNCRATYPLIKSILGRTGDLIYKKDGESISISGFLSSISPREKDHFQQSGGHQSIFCTTR